MYIPEEMKVNKFVSVHLPENAVYFSRFGYQVPQSQMYTGDDRAVMPQNKVDSINDYMEYAKQMSNEQYNKNEEP